MLSTHTNHFETFFSEDRTVVGYSVNAAYRRGCTVTVNHMALNLQAPLFELFQCPPPPPSGSEVEHKTLTLVKSA